MRPTSHRTSRLRTAAACSVVAPAVLLLSVGSTAAAQPPPQPEPAAAHPPANAAVKAAASPARTVDFPAPVALWLTITPEPGNEQDEFTGVTLYCHPAGGTHPAPADACASLTAVHGRFADLPSGGGCAGVWIPVTIAATGSWYGRHVDWKERHSNLGCAIAATDRVFNF